MEITKLSDNALDSLFELGKETFLKLRNEFKIADEKETYFFYAIEKPLITAEQEAYYNDQLWKYRAILKDLKKKLNVRNIFELGF